MLTEKDYCNNDITVVLEELGFPIRRIKVKGKEKNIPILLYEAQMWLREERGILLQPTYLELSDEWICVIHDKNKRHGYSTQKQKDYEETLFEGIKEVVKILKEEK